MKEQNKYYWEGKMQRASIAKEHTKAMDKHYGDAIKEIVQKTKIYSAPITMQTATPTKDNISMEIARTDSVSALFDLVDCTGKIAMLNFASYKYAGGGFMNGSRAQEECLCHESFLYNVLREFDASYYEPNRNDLNKALYRHKAIYSPDIFFIRDGKGKKCDVVTCASPNFSAAEKHVSRDENNKVLRERVRFVLEIAKQNHVDTFIVGAWGCGVFKQDPNVVAQYFAEESQNVFTDAKINLVFAVIPPLPNQTDNLTPFVKMVNDWNVNK
jgi:uncharacterized protein (TIGR02452 family)